ncbi:MAG TPA: amidase family protein [Hyphomicrobiales bacterium]|nr:amidase family protein [Hyphomicrobiales bacterium]
MPDSPVAWSVAELASAYRRRALSPVEMLEALLAAIERDHGRVNAFALLDPERGLAAARESERRFSTGRPLGPLDGIPVSVKDLTAAAGWPTRRGSRATEGEPPAAADAPGVALVRAAGAVLFGKTTTSEFGWAAISECPHTGRTANPVAPGRTAGGSSAGAAAQMAANWGPVALGSDAGGSIRIPASYCGLTGFKPSYGWVPQAPLSAFGDLSHLGPLARSVDDCAVLTAAMAHPDPRDPASLFPRMAAAAEAGKPRIGWMLRLGEQRARVAPEVEAALRTTVEALARADHEVTEVAWPGLDVADAIWVSWQARNFESFVDWPAERRAQLSPYLQKLAEEGEALTMTAAARSRQTLRDAAGRIAAAFETIDLLLMPATPDGPFLMGDLAPRADPGFARIAATGDWLAANPYGYPFNLTGQPALVLPLGTTGEGLPFGLQIVGRRYDDARVLAFGQMLEAMRAR